MTQFSRNVNIAETPPAVPPTAISSSTLTCVNSPLTTALALATAPAKQPLARLFSSSLHVTAPFLSMDTAALRFDVTSSPTVRVAIPILNVTSVVLELARWREVVLRCTLPAALYVQIVRMELVRVENALAIQAMEATFAI
jgi:hypothetical protein